MTTKPSYLGREVHSILSAAFTAADLLKADAVEAGEAHAGRLYQAAVAAGAAFIDAANAKADKLVLSVLEPVRGRKVAAATDRLPDDAVTSTTAPTGRPATHTGNANHA